MGNRTALVVSAHSADFVWRCGGAIALHQSRGYDVTVVCLSYGERGESAKLWKQDGMTLDKVKAARREEAGAPPQRSARMTSTSSISATIPSRWTATAKDRLVDVIREVQPPSSSPIRNTIPTTPTTCMPTRSRSSAG